MTRAVFDRQDKASKVVESWRVKKHVFLPSGRTLWTVVGSEGDFLVDFESKTMKSYCSCRDYHFRVLSGTIAECYHLIAARRALNFQKFEVIRFSDQEYSEFLKLLIRDLFSHMN